MSVLVDKDILAAMERGEIVIDPFDRACLGTNSYDVHLAPVLRTYVKDYTQVLSKITHASREPAVTIDPAGGGLPVFTELVSETTYQPLPLDVRTKSATEDVPIPEEGIVLVPGILYLASTVEHTESSDHVPMLNGRSSLGRLGLSIHVTAGTGDVGFRGCWTMELFVVQPLRIYAGIQIGQLLWMTASGEPDVPYHSKASAKYGGRGRPPLPQASKLHVELGRGSGK